MGFRDIASNVLTRYKANTDDHRRELDKLSAKEKKRNSQLAVQLKQQEAGYTRAIGAIGKVTVAIGAITAAAVVAKKAMNAWVEDTRMRAAATGISIDKLRVASEGLITKQNLLALAATNQNSAYKLTQPQLEKVTALMVDLNRQGNDAAKIQQAFTDVIAKGSVRSLKQFGVGVEGVKNGVDAMNRLMQEAEKRHSGLASAGEDATKSEIALADAMHDVKVSFGEMASKVLPTLTNALASVVAQMADIVDVLNDVPSWATGGVPGVSRKTLIKGVAGANIFSNVKNLQKLLPDGGGIDLPWAQGAGGDDVVGGLILKANIDAWVANRQQQVKAQLDADAAAADAASAAQRKKDWQAVFQQDWDPIGDLGRKMREHQAKNKRPGSGQRRNRLEGFDPMQALFDLLPNEFQLSEGIGAFAGMSSVQSELRRQQGPSLLGPMSLGEDNSITTQAELEQIALDGSIEKTKLAIESINQHSGAFNILGSSATAAYQAIVTGSESMGAALKHAAGQGLLAEGTRLFGTAISETVMAAVALARAIGGNPMALAEAGAHAKAAGLAYAGAASLGGLARAMGVGGSPSAGAGASAGAGVGGAMGSMGRSTSNTFIIGDGVLTGSSRQNAANIRRVLERADREDNGSRDRVGGWG